MRFLINQNLKNYSVWSWVKSKAPQNWGDRIDILGKHIFKKNNKLIIQTKHLILMKLSETFQIQYKNIFQDWNFLLVNSMWDTFGCWACWWCLIIFGIFCIYLYTVYSPTTESPSVIHPLFDAMQWRCKSV